MLDEFGEPDHYNPAYVFEPHSEEWVLIGVSLVPEEAGDLFRAPSSEAAPRWAGDGLFGEPSDKDACTDDLSLKS